MGRSASAGRHERRRGFKSRFRFLLIIDRPDGNKPGLILQCVCVCGSCGCSRSPAHILPFMTIICLLSQRQNARISFHIFLRNTRLVTHFSFQQNPSQQGRGSVAVSQKFILTFTRRLLGLLAMLNQPAITMLAQKTLCSL